MLGSGLWPFRVTGGHLSRDHWTPDMQFPIGGPLKPSLYLTSLLRYYVSNTLPSIFPLKMHWSPFFCFRGQNWGCIVLQLCTCSRSLATSFELLNHHNRSTGLATVVFGPFRWKALWGWKIGAKSGKCRQILIPNKSILTFWVPNFCAEKISSHPNKNCDCISHFVEITTLTYINTTGMWRRIDNCTCAATAKFATRIAAVILIANGLRQCTCDWRSWIGHLTCVMWYDWQANESFGEFCTDYDYEGCKNDPECVWCLELAAEAGAGCLHLSRSSVVDADFSSRLCWQKC